MRANPQTEKGFIRIANELWEEIIRRDFSKRQSNIIMLIWRLSYGTNQKDCVIEKLTLFSITGLYKQDIKKELNFLCECSVLNWNKQTMTFSINKDHEFWKINPSKNWDRDKMNYLIHQNIKRKKINMIDRNDKSLTSKTLTFKNGEVSKVLKVKFVKDLPKKALILSAARSTKVPNTLLETSITDITTTKGIDEIAKKILNKYLELKGQTNFNNKDKIASQEIAREGISAKEAITYLEMKFQHHEKNKKHKYDKINGLNYCAGYILDQYHNKKEGDLNEPRIQKSKQYNSSSNTKSRKYEQKLREIESAKTSSGL